MYSIASLPVFFLLANTRKGFLQCTVLWQQLPLAGCAHLSRSTAAQRAQYMLLLGLVVPHLCTAQLPADRHYLETPAYTLAEPATPSFRRTHSAKRPAWMSSHLPGARRWTLGEAVGPTSGPAAASTTASRRTLTHGSAEPHIEYIQ